MADSQSPVLSVIIVNYNVKYFLEQCINSVRAASKNLGVETFVVDNLSVDGSIELVKEQFPEVHLITNSQNVGFSKANNQAIRLAKGKYILLLNPDTIVQEDTFEKCVDFMEEHPQAGGLGVKMVDGKGKFLPESKRALPTPSVAFWKIFGFSQIFPKSPIFGKYHLGHLDRDKNHEVEVLSGAFMLMRKETLDKVGLLDENFFMYGEDIDLSYRITQGGYTNHYFAETSIIHYKGESTKKSSINYVYIFYKAMVIFAEKHYSAKNARLFSLLIHFAIWLRAGLAMLFRLFQRVTLPVVDFAFLCGGMLALTRYWQLALIEFPDFVFQLTIPLYACIFLGGAYLKGIYDRRFRYFSVAKGVLIAVLFILIAYGLLPKAWQFSRLFILLSFGWALLYIAISRVWLHWVIGGKFSLSSGVRKRFLLIGASDETKRVEELLKQTFGKIETVQHFQKRHDGENNTLEKIVTTLQIHKINEVIFCAKDLRSAEIIDWISKLPSEGIDFKIAQPETDFLIGSNSINTAGDLYLVQINRIDLPEQRRYKRLFDVVFSFLLLAASPVLLWFYNHKLQFIKNMLNVLLGRKSLVGLTAKSSANALSKTAKNGVLLPSDSVNTNEILTHNRVDLLYAKDYSVWKDWKILQSSWLKLDKNR